MLVGLRLGAKAADKNEMRYLAAAVVTLLLAGPAAAATPRFALFDLQSDLAHASRNPYGDVAVQPLSRLEGKGTLVRCATWCRFGSGWLAFAQPPRLSAADVAGATVRYTRRQGWTVRLSLRAAAQGRWTAFSRNVLAQAKLHGVPDVLVVVAGGEVAASPLATQVTSSKGVVTLTGFTQASAKALQKAVS
jgi:hypothetical protein